MFNSFTLNGPTVLPFATLDLMAAVVNALRAQPGLATALGDTGPGAGAKIFADATFVSAQLPYLVYSEPEESQERMFGGTTIGNGSFEIGVFTTKNLTTGGKQAARQLIQLVRMAVNGMTVPQNVGEGMLAYIKNADGKSREILSPAPTSATDPTGMPQVFEFGRAMTFTYKLVRTDP